MVTERLTWRTERFDRAVPSFTRHIGSYENVRVLITQSDVASYRIQWHVRVKDIPVQLFGRPSPFVMDGVPQAKAAAELFVEELNLVC